VLTLIDEVLTPDSSRFWPIDGLLAAMAAGVPPPSFDKQETRDEGLKAGVKKGVPWIPPKELNDRTSGKYRNINELLVGKPLERYQYEDMGI
jgi:phosphoribosylaminoimidazole-succinocarboxamide synthase